MKWPATALVSLIIIALLESVVEGIIDSITIQEGQFYMFPFDQSSSVLRYNIAEKVLRIGYSCLESGYRTVQLATNFELRNPQRHMPTGVRRFTRNYPFSVPRFPGEANYISIPLSDFGESLPGFGGVKIGGPLSVTYLEIVDTGVVSRIYFNDYQRTYNELAANIDPLDPAQDFKRKLITFKRELQALRVFGLELDFPVRRTHIWEDVYPLVIHLDYLRLHQILKINFKDEDGSDSGGLTREFFSLLANVINNPNYALFTSTPESGYALQINPSSISQGEHHLQYFKVVGRIIGMALLSDSILGVRLVPSLYRKFRTEPIASLDLPELMEKDDSDVDISEVKAFDSELYKRLDWILNNNITVFPEPMTMSTEWPINGELVYFDLVKDGSQHTVTQANKKQYVREYVRWRIETLVNDQANALRDGLWDVVPQSLLSKFTDSELEILIAGQSEIDLDDWKKHTAYEFPYYEEHPSIQWFWQCLETWDNEELAKLLLFATGSPRVPSTGFSGLLWQFTISFNNDKEQYPSASTCFNNLKLPPYDSLNIMRDRLTYTIEEGLGVFGLA